MLSTKIIMQSVQNFLTACGTILAHCLETGDLKASSAVRSLSWYSCVSFFYLRQGTLQSQTKKSIPRRWIFLLSMSIFCFSYLSVFFSTVPISAAFPPLHFVTLVISANIFHNNPRHLSQKYNRIGLFFCFFLDFRIPLYSIVLRASVRDIGTFLHCKRGFFDT